MSRKYFLFIAAMFLTSTVFAQVTRKTEGTPVIGDKYEMSIQLTPSRKIILPQGIWEVNNVYDDKEPSWHAPYKVITLTNTNEDSPFRILITRIFLQSASKWAEEPCEKKNTTGAFGYLKNNTVAGKSVCAQYAIFSNPQTMLKSYLPNNYKFHWEKTVSKLTDEHLKGISKNSLLFEVYANKSGDLYIKQEMIIDPFALGINGEQFKSRYNDNTSDPVVRMTNWRERYIAKMIDAFFAGKEPNAEDVTLVPLPEKTVVAANIEPEKSSSTKPNNSATNDSSKQDSELKKLEEERRKLDEERRLFNEQKALAEEKKKFEEEKRQFELSKQSSQGSSTKPAASAETKTAVADDLKAKNQSEKSAATEDKPTMSAEDKKQQAALAKKLDQEEKQRLADEKKKAEEEKKQQAALAKKLEQEEKQRLADEKKKADEDKKAEAKAQKEQEVLEAKLKKEKAAEEEKAKKQQAIDAAKAALEKTKYIESQNDNNQIIKAYYETIKKIPDSSGLSFFTILNLDEPKQIEGKNFKSVKVKVRAYCSDYSGRTETQELFSELNGSGELIYSNNKFDFKLDKGKGSYSSPQMVKDICEYGFKNKLTIISERIKSLTDIPLDFDDSLVYRSIESKEVQNQICKSIEMFTPSSLDIKNPPFYRELAANKGRSFLSTKYFDHACILYFNYKGIYEGTSYNKDVKCYLYTFRRVAGNPKIFKADMLDYCVDN